MSNTQNIGRRLKTGFAVLALATVSTAGPGGVAQASTASHRAVSASQHGTHRHRVHRQALKGRLSASHVPVLKVGLIGGKGGGGDPGDDYPAEYKNRPMDSVVDQWGEYNRECTSFVAWALYSRNGFVMPFHDNANRWGSDAAGRGYAVNSSPAIGSVAWSNAGTYGHVAYVVGVNGGTVTIAEYNEHYTGTFDERTVSGSAFTGYIHFKDQPPALTTPTMPTPAPTSTAPTTPPTTAIGSPAPATTTGSPPPTTTTSTPTPTPAPAPTYTETTGGVTHTWTNYSNAGGTEGPSISGSTSVQIACKLSGFAVADGDTWWYRVASAPWNGSYYASADAFYNDGATSGSLHGTPFVDPNVPNC